MKLSQEQIKLISSSILVNDIISYINEHFDEYEEFIKNQNSEN